MRRRPPTGAVTRTVRGLANIGRKLLRPMWPRKGQGATSAPRSSQQGRRSTHHLLCRRRAREGINPLACVGSRPARQGGEEGAEDQLPASMDQKWNDLKYAPGKIRGRNWIGPHRPQERGTCGERQSCEDGQAAGGTTIKVRLGPGAPPLDGIADGCKW